eukprot:363570-Chlamydomonas_euryale.AAC.1
MHKFRSAAAWACRPVRRRRRRRRFAHRDSDRVARRCAAPGGRAPPPWPDGRSANLLGGSAGVGGGGWQVWGHAGRGSPAAGACGASDWCLEGLASLVGRWLQPTGSRCRRGAIGQYSARWVGSPAGGWVGGGIQSDGNGDHACTCT